MRGQLSLIILLLGLSGSINAQGKMKTNEVLNARDTHLVEIVSLTARANYEGLAGQLNSALQDGMTVNEINDIYLQMYAYIGFPRSIWGSYVFMDVVEKRRTAGQKAEQGREPSAVRKDYSDLFAYGEKILTEVTGQTAEQSRAGVMNFNAKLDVFLKEHLFADIFTSDLFTYGERELITLTALLSTTPMETISTGAHFSVALLNGITEPQLEQVLAIVEANVGREAAETGKALLDEAIKSQNK